MAQSKKKPVEVTPEAIKPLDEVLQIMATAVAEWKIENTEAKIKEKVKKLLDQNSEEITMKLLGFNKSSWSDKWELDHCNGRAGESSAGDYLRRVQSAAIKEWMEDLPLPKLSPTLKGQLAKQMQSDFNERVRYQASSFIRSKAEIQTNVALEELLQCKELDNYIKSMKLIGG